MRLGIMGGSQGGLLVSGSMILSLAITAGDRERPGPNQGTASRYGDGILSWVPTLSLVGSVISGFAPWRAARVTSNCFAIAQSVSPFLTT